MNNLSIGQRIREIRKERGLTLVEVAGKEFTKGYISQVELGKVNPSFKLLCHIANKLGIKVEQLLSLDSKLDYQLAIIENEFVCERYKKVIDLSKGIDNIIKNPTIAKIKLIQSKAFYYLNRFQDCIDSTKEVLKLNQEWSINYRLEAFSFLGLSLFAQKSYIEAIKLYDEAFEFATRNELNNSKLLANIYLNKATAYQNLEEYKEAIKIFNETLSFSKEHECMETVLDAFIRLGFCHYKVGNLDIAKKYIYDGFKINRILENKLSQAEALLILSYIMIDEKNYKATEFILNKTLPLFEEVNRVQGVVESLLILSKVYKETRQNSIGMEKLLESVKIIESKNSNIFEHSLLKEIAKTCMELGLHEKASMIFSKLVDY